MPLFIDDSPWLAPHPHPPSLSQRVKSLCQLFAGRGSYFSRCPFYFSSPPFFFPCFLRSVKSFFAPNENVRLGSSRDQDGKSNVWAVEPKMRVEVSMRTRVARQYQCVPLLTGRPINMAVNFSAIVPMRSIRREKYLSLAPSQHQTFQIIFCLDPRCCRLYLVPKSGRVAHSCSEPRNNKGAIVANLPHRPPSPLRSFFAGD